MVQRATLALVVLAAGSIVLAAGSRPAHAENLLVNPRFDTSLTGWGVGNSKQVWSPLDADGSPGSGSAKGLIDQAPDRFTAVAFRQCVEVSDAIEYAIGISAFIPPGQDRTGSANAAAYFYADETCGGAADIVSLGSVGTPGAWSEIADTLTPPAGSRSVTLFLSITKIELGGQIEAHFDDACVGSGGDCTTAAPPPPYDSWIGSPGLPGFEAQVRITPSGATPIQGSEEPDCIGETLCSYGALAGRPEIFAKVIGPRPNGFLWVQLIRFTPSTVEVWLRQVATGEINYYVLDAVAPGAGVLSGLEDREAYLP